MGLNLYRGFESLRLRQLAIAVIAVWQSPFSFLPYRQRRVGGFLSTRRIYASL